MDIRPEDVEALLTIASAELNRIATQSRDAISRSQTLDAQRELMQTHKPLLDSKEGSQTYAAILKTLRSNFVSKPEFEAVKQDLRRVRSDLEARELAWSNAGAVLDRYYALEPPPPVSDFNLVIRISYEDYLTRHDLGLILRSLDEIVEEEVLLAASGDGMPGGTVEALRAALKESPQRTFIGLAHVEPGSVLVSVLASPDILVLAAGYAAAKVAGGFQTAGLAKELARTGRIAGKVLVAIVQKFNDWAERQLVGQVGRVKATAEEASPPAKTPKPPRTRRL